MPYFTVVIPLYNKQNYIAATLKSVLAQTFTDFEVIVVNDVATDNSLTVAHAVHDKRIRFVDHTVNKGLSASRNTGIKNAQAEFIAFLDADDIWKPQFLEKIHELIVNFPEADLFATKYDEIYPGNIVIEHHFKLSSGIIENFFTNSLSQHIYCYSSIAVRKKAFDKTGLFDENITMGEDIDFNVRANIASKLAYSNEPWARITIQSENQITHSSLEGKTIIDHDFYEKSNPGRADIKRYLDFHRYTMAKRYKLAGDMVTYQKLTGAISLKNLNYKQVILLYAPAFVLRGIGRLKALLIKKGLNPTTY
jgi:glycosyltransferase involved in cell wall biosynthesis